MILRNIEFYGMPDGEIEVRIKNEMPFKLEINHREFICSFIQLLRDKRMIALENLEKRYAKSKFNIEYYEFLIVRGFIKCNFLVFDNHSDIDENGNINTEYVLCPRTGECPECGLICNSPVNTELTIREIDVLRLIKDGYENVEIADKLYISVNTVHVHRNNILRKLGKNNTAELVKYWYESNLS